MCNNNLIKKYSIGILVSYTLLVLSSVYSMKIIAVITGIESLIAQNFFLSRLFFWIIFVLLVIYSMIFEKNNFLIWKEKNYKLWKFIFFVISVYFISIIGSGILSFIIQKIYPEEMSSKILLMSKIFKSNFLLLVFTCFTAAITEEFIFRGYIQTRLEKIYNNPTVAIIISSLLFGILHSGYGTLRQVIGPFFIGLTFAIFYKKYSNLKILIIVHFLIDFISLLSLTRFPIKF